MPTVRLVVSTTKRLLPLVSEVLFAAGAQGLEERSGRRAVLVTYAETHAPLAAIWKRSQAALRAALEPSQVPTAAIEVDSVESWRKTWTEHLQPVALTARLVLAPVGAEPGSIARGKQVIVYQPALAFGDGAHPTTRLAARAIEAHYRKSPGGTLLDIGAGTGVLSLVSVCSGARRALGVEIDEAALLAARANAKLNGLARQTRFVDSSARLSGSFDLVVVNIELRPLLQVLARLPTAAKRAPKLLVTGFLSSQLAEVTRAVQDAGFRIRSRKAEGDWRLLDARSKLAAAP